MASPNGKPVRDRQTGQIVGVFQDGRIVPTAQGPINSGVDPGDVIAQQNSAISAANSRRGDAQFNYQIQRDQVEDQRFEREQADKERQAEESRLDAAAALSRTIEKIDAIKADSTDSWTGVDGLGETGMTGALQGGIPGSPAYSLRKDLGTIDSTQVLQAMTRLKELSPTGSTGFGALSAPELELLKSSVARLDPNMDQQTFVQNLEAARKVYSDMLARIDGGKKGAEVLTQAIREGRSRQEILDLAAQNNLTVNEADLDANLRSRDAGGTTNEVLPPDIEAIMQKYGAN